MNKRKMQKIHAKSRFFERHDILLTKDLHKELINNIQNGKAKFVKKQSNRVTLWDIDFTDKLIRVVYDKHRKLIITTLPVQEEVV